MQVSDKLITHWRKRLKNMGLLGIRKITFINNLLTNPFEITYPHSIKALS